MALMAALPEWSEPRVVELRRISAADLEPVLAEEAVAWRAALAWDLSSSAELVRRYTRMQVLNGFALLDGPHVIGYAYYVREEHKGLIGDLYVLEKYRTPARENALIEAVLNELRRLPGVRRTEAQLLMLSGTADRSVPFADVVRIHPRWFLEFPLKDAAALLPLQRSGIRLQPWRESNFEEAAKLVANSYRGHVDSDINDQYRSPTGARRFLSNIVEFPGCGIFFPAASYAAFDSAGFLCGISLASLVAPDSGHITQLCVAPSHRNIGLGAELLRRSLLSFAAHGCGSASLTVTAANQGALRLYERMGFVRRRHFAAHVWNFR